MNWSIKENIQVGVPMLLFHKRTVLARYRMIWFQFCMWNRNPTLISQYINYSVLYKSSFCCPTHKILMMLYENQILGRATPWLAVCRHYYTPHTGDWWILSNFFLTSEYVPCTHVLLKEASRRNPHSSTLIYFAYFQF